jgi:hypothetical protein
MIRRDFIKLVVASLSAIRLRATAQRSPRHWSPVTGDSTNTVQFERHCILAGYARARYVEGKTIPSVAVADGDYAPSRTRDELVRLKVNVIFATSTPSILAARRGPTSIPIVMGFYEDNPTEYGVAASLGHPGERTGLAAMEVKVVDIWTLYGHASASGPSRILINQSELPPLPNWRWQKRPE